MLWKNRIAGAGVDEKTPVGQLVDARDDGVKASLAV
jgi:hypothetical protein